MGLEAESGNAGQRHLLVLVALHARNADRAHDFALAPASPRPLAAFRIGLAAVLLVARWPRRALFLVATTFVAWSLTPVLKAAGYGGLLAVEVDHLHPDYRYDEHAAVRRSIQELRRIVDSLN